MANFNFEIEMKPIEENRLSNWISQVISSENKKEGDLNYIFCTDEYLHRLNLEFLKHDTYTDILSFDYTIGNLISGDIYISVERVLENASEFGVDFEEELRRVMIHGVLHYCGYKDGTSEEKNMMRDKENYYLHSYQNF